MSADIPVIEVDAADMCASTALADRARFGHSVAVEVVTPEPDLLIGGRGARAQLGDTLSQGCRRCKA
jgi:hypothetical protein